MALEKRTRMYEVLIRFHADGGIFAHQQKITEVVEDGVVQAATLGPAEALSIADIGDLIAPETAATLAMLERALSVLTFEQAQAIGLAV